MRKKIVILLAIVCIVMLAGCGKNAEPIDLPSNEAVTSIEVITIDGAKADITETTVYNLLKKHVDSKKKLLWSIVGSNIVTTAMVAVIERMVTDGYWV